MSKQHKDLPENLQQYVFNIAVYEDSILQKLREETEQLKDAGMMTVPEQSQFLGWLIRLMAARRVIEVGVFTGYSTLVMARALPEDGQLIACDRNIEWTSVGLPFWKQANIDDKISLCLAPAQETLQNLLDEGNAGSIDFIYIDADKINYPNYYELGLSLLRNGGVIALDNMLWVGDVAVHTRQNPATRALYDLSEKIRNDQRVEPSFLAIGSGLMLVQKK